MYLLIASQEHLNHPDRLWNQDSIGCQARFKKRITDNQDYCFQNRLIIIKTRFLSIKSSRSRISCSVMGPAAIAVYNIIALITLLYYISLHCKYVKMHTDHCNPKFQTLSFLLFILTHRLTFLKCYGLFLGHLVNKICLNTSLPLCCYLHICKKITKF